MSDTICLIGGGTVGRQITDRLEHRGDSVIVVERDEQRAAALEADGHQVYHGDGTDVATLEAAGAADATTVVVATGDDDTNLLAAQLVRNEFSPDSVIARVNQPENEDPFEELGIRTVSRPDATAKMLDGLIESSAMTRWMETVGHEGEIQEIVVQNPDLAGSTVQELDAQLPEQILLVMVGSEGDAHLPNPEEVVELGDHVTVIGERDAVMQALHDLSDGDEGTSESERAERSERSQRRR